MNTGAAHAGSSTAATTSNAGASSTHTGATATGAKTATPVTPGADLSTYISTSLKGHGTKTLEAEVPASAKAFLKATTASVTAFDTEVNAYVKEEVAAEKALAARVGSGFTVGTPELKFTDQIMKLSLRHNVGFIAPCKDEKKTGGDLVCAMHVEHTLPSRRVRKIFAVVQIKVAERYKRLEPTVDFTHTNSNGLQLELLAKEVIKKRAELDSDVDVLGAYGVTHEDRSVFLPIDDILDHYKGAHVDTSAPFSRKVTADLFNKYGKAKGFLEEMLNYVEKRDVLPPRSPSPMSIDSNHSH
ncbi:hypothetical protein FRC17_001456 [Serendipita sp. 399]|nr:hypothetical protein FRC17_001456 [Serendipita sp. 399]